MSNISIEQLLSLKNDVESTFVYYDRISHQIKAIDYVNILIMIISILLPIAITEYSSLMKFLENLISTSVVLFQGFALASFSISLILLMSFNYIAILRYKITKKFSSKLKNFTGNLTSWYGKIYTKIVLRSIVILFFLSLIPYILQLITLLTQGIPINEIITLNAIQITTFLLIIMILIPNDRFTSFKNSRLRSIDNTTVTYVNQAKQLFNYDGYLIPIFDSFDGEGIKLISILLLIVLFIIYYVAAFSWQYLHSPFNLFLAITIEGSIFVFFTSIQLLAKNRESVKEVNYRIDTVTSELADLRADIISVSNNQDFDNDYNKLIDRYLKIKQVRLESRIMPSFIKTYIYKINDIK